MPSSVHDLNPDSDGVREFLAAVLPDSHLSRAAVSEAYEPLLLLRTDNVVAAFAFANGDMRKSYETLYAGFKGYYAQQHGTWDALDLAFIFCVSPEAPQLDQFCSNVETDVFFCRKFVVPLASPLDVSLARLPFLPLASPRSQSLRPLPAQVFLQRSGVPAQLARCLVLKYERSPEGIVKDCLASKFGRPQKLAPVASTQFDRPPWPSDPVRLDRVEIQSFRAYRSPQTFDVGAAVTVLHGPNGFGKTSFFDAIDFAITGGIGRFRSLSEPAFAKITRHLDSALEDCSVSLTLHASGGVRRLTRTLSDPKRALLDDKPTDRKTILLQQTGGAAPETERVDTLVSLFRASHLFGQDMQALAEGFTEDCRLPVDIVSRMLAFEDYANAVAKADKVREVLQTEIANAEKETRELSKQLATNRSQIERLGKASEGRGDLALLDWEINALSVKLADVGLAVPPQKPDAATLRGWRAALESRCIEIQKAIGRLSILTKEAAELPRTRDELAAIQRQLEEKERESRSTEARCNAAILDLQAAEGCVADITAQCVELEDRASRLEWIRITKPAYAQLLEAQQAASEEARRVYGAESQLRVAGQHAIKEFTSQEALALEVGDKLRVQTAELEALRCLSESLAHWRANLARLDTLLPIEQDLSGSLASSQAETNALSQQISAVTAEEKRLSGQLAEMDQVQSDLRRLVSQLLPLVRSSQCPLCGGNHGSRDQLVRRIQQHLAADSSISTRTALANAQEEHRALARKKATIEQKVQDLQVRLVALRDERAALSEELGHFAKAAADLGVTSAGPDQGLSDELSLRITHAESKLADLRHQTGKVKVALDAARSAVAASKRLVSGSSAEFADRKAQLLRLKEELSRLISDPRNAEISLSVEPDELAKLERDNAQHLAHLKEELIESTRQRDRMKREATALRQDVSGLKAQLSTLSHRRAAIQGAMAQVVARLEEAELPPDATEQHMLSRVTEQSRLQAQLLLLRDSVSSLEVAMDAATTAAALTSLHEDIRNMEERHTHFREQRNRCHPWLAYFGDLSRYLHSQQHQAVARFTEDYGPLTSVIQRRLRSVYGFDEIELHTSESCIDVRVRRRGEELRPTDYFSQSQQQTLLLGLFLTACSSQTWSTFTPVLLDDPVTHLDNLNLYAFLDLVAGLLESEFQGRQFIISTCNEKLLQLARQKFRRFGHAAKFYEFMTMGPNGPTVREIPSS